MPWKVLPENNIPAEMFIFPPVVMPLFIGCEHHVVQCWFLQSKSTIIIVPLTKLLSIIAGDRRIEYLCRSWVRQDQNTKNTVPSEMETSVLTDASQVFFWWYFNKCGLNCWFLWNAMVTMAQAILCFNIFAYQGAINSLVYWMKQFFWWFLNWHWLKFAFSWLSRDGFF